jgi:hypothetical protein
MARDHARIFTAIWSDPDFRALPVPPQHTFFMLLSQPRLSYCGVMDYLPNRLSKMSAKATARTTANAVSSLEKARFVVTDEDTGELLIRSFVRHDGLLAMPNMTKAMTKDYLAVLSDPLREAIKSELSRAFTESPDLGGWKGLAQASPELHAEVTAKGSRKGSANG